MENSALYLSFSQAQVIWLCLLLLAVQIYAVFRWGKASGKIDLCTHLGLRKGEDGEKEWVLVPVEMRGIKIEGDTSGLDPVTMVLLNVRTRQVRAPVDCELREITINTHTLGIPRGYVVLGAPTYYPVNRRSGSVVMLGAEYVAFKHIKPSMATSTD